ncbi:DUF533 domain-containing protein [Nitrincola tibetensis]|uniref:DUF533 domain-containing protein n=1 Tax=Nitrincola tibetensis TaxID=2219697 RepID=A0A364NKG6_9GAMM|nr:tellurite resistance TerB family protein [Nitrincola tibetensis]RAU17573.1 DUF533 domain-containing protein [Nitrincola tibetensis]
MNTSNFLDMLLKKGTELVNQQSSSLSSVKDKLPNELGGLLSGKTGAALGGGALGLLLGNKKARNMGGKVAAYGGLAALGVMAYKAYGNWQQQQAPAGQVIPEPQTLDRLPAPEVEVHSQAVMRALIGAAKADGHIDDRERELIDQALERQGADLSMVQWVDAELKKPLDPADVATSAKTPEMAAEMYLASLLVIDEQSYMERVYLKELAVQLKLTPELVAELERQVAEAK